jgi:hypothetical protein
MVGLSTSIERVGGETEFRRKIRMLKTVVGDSKRVVCGRCKRS